MPNNWCTLPSLMVSPAAQCFQSATTFAARELWGLLRTPATEVSPLPVPCRAQTEEAHVSHVYSMSATITTA